MRPQLPKPLKLPFHKAPSPSAKTPTPQAMAHVQAQSSCEVVDGEVALLQVGLRAASRSLGGALALGITEQWDALELMGALFPDAVEGYEASRERKSAYGGIWAQAKATHRLAPSVPSQVKRIPNPTNGAYAFVRVATAADADVLLGLALPAGVIVCASIKVIDEFLAKSGRVAITLAIVEHRLACIRLA